MTPEQKQTKNNNRRSLYFNLVIIGAIISLFVFFQTQIDGRIESHPKVIGLEIKQDYTRQELREIKGQLRVINEKIDELLEAAQ